MISAYVLKTLSFPLVPILNRTKDRLGSNNVKVVDHIKNAECLIVPHNFNYIKSNENLYNYYYHTINGNDSKPIIVFDTGDINKFPKELMKKNVVIFSSNIYKTDKNKIPYLAINKEFNFFPINPALSIGFCGWTDYVNIREAIAYNVFSAVDYIKNIHSSPNAHIKGLIWRKRLTNLKWEHNEIKTDFVIRRSYTNAQSTRLIDKNIAEQDYRRVLKDNLYQLTIKGDGNYSMRFYEIMSAGRIPVLLDTDVKLPLEDMIDYQSLMVRIPLHQWKDAPRILANFHNSFSTKELIHKQQKNQEIYRKYFQNNNYFHYVFNKEYIRKYFKK